MLMLKQNFTNSLQEFHVAPHYSFSCKPYGIVTIDEVLYSKNTGDECKQVLQRFYLRNPKLQNLHYRYLHRKSFYHVEYQEQSCIIYAKGELTYSEILLKEGVALMQKDLKNKIFEPRFQSAQKSAEVQRKGIFKDKNILECLETD